MAGCGGDFGNSRIPPWEISSPGQDSNFPLEGDFNAQIEADLPAHGDDPSQPMVCDEYHWYADFCLDAGRALIEIPVRIRNGAIDLSGNLANLSSLRFTSWTPDFLPRSIQLDDEGQPHIVGEAGLISDYWERIRALDTFPFGFDDSGRLVCDEDNRGNVETPLEVTSWIRNNGLPESLTFSTLLYLADNFQEAQAVGGCPPDPDLKINLPADPASLISNISLRGSLRTTGRQLTIPESENRPPIVIDFGEGPNVLTTNLDLHGPFSSTQIPQVQGSVHAAFDIQNLRAGVMTFPGPHQGELNITVADSGIAAGFAGVFTAPPSEIPQAGISIRQGRIRPRLDWFLQPNPTPESVAGRFSGRVNLDDFQATIAGQELDLDAMLAAGGEFSWEKNLLSADFNFETDLAGRFGTTEAEAKFSSRVSVEDYGYCAPDGLLITRRHLDFSNLSAAVSGNLPGFTVTGPRGAVADGPDATLDGESISPGIHIASDLIGQNIGTLTQARINTRVSGLRLQTPQGTFEASGQLIGRMQLVNISDDPAKPDLRPVAGSLHFELRNGRVAQVVEGERTILMNGGTVSIQDDPWGRVHITAEGRVPLLSQFGISGPEAQFTIQIDPDAIRPYTLEKICSDDPFTSIDEALSYYEPKEMNEIAIPTILLRLAQRNIGVLAARGSASIRDLQTGNPQAEFRVDLPFGRRTFPLPHGEATISGGGVTAAGTNDRIGVTIRPPRRVHVQFSQSQDEGGVTYEFAGDLRPTGRFHATVNPRAGVVHFQGRNSPRLDGTLAVTARNPDGSTIGGGEVRISSPYEIRGSATETGSRFAISIPQTQIEARVTQPINAGEVTIPVGSALNLPITGFSGEVFVDTRTLRMTSRWTMADIGPASLSIPGSPLANLSTVSLPGPVSVSAEGNANDQQVSVTSNPRTGVSLSTTDPAETYELQLRAAVGDVAALNLLSQTRAEGIDLSFNPATGRVDLAIQDFSLLSEIDGQVQLPGLGINLNGLDTRGALQRLSLSLNPRTGDLRLELTPHTLSPMAMPPEDLPDNLNAWLTWSRADWERYRTEMNDPARKHLAVLSEESANLPGSPFPPGRGRIYIDLKPTSEAVNLRDFRNNVPEAVTHLLKNLLGNLEMRREFPNPPIPSEPPPESIIYNPGQDALFILNPRDTELIEHIEYGLGIPNADARRLFQNGRIDINDLLQIPTLKDHLSPETMRGLVDAFFRPEDRTERFFSNNTHRFFLTLGDIRANLARMVGFHEEYWSRNVRSTLPRNFNDPSYQGGAPGGVRDGINMTLYNYIPYPPEKVMGVIRNLRDYQYWMPWVTSSGMESDGSFRGTILDDHLYRVRGRTDNYGPVQAFSYEPAGGEGLQIFAARTLAIPATGSQGRPVGTFLIGEHAIDFPGRDEAIYVGRDIDRSSLGDPARPLFSSNHPFWTRLPDTTLGGAPTFWTDVPMVGHRMELIGHPNRNPFDIFSSRMALAQSNLYRLLYENKQPGEIDFREYQAEAANLSVTPEGVVNTRPPEEFMHLEGGVIRLEVEPADRNRVATLLTEGLGISRTDAENLIASGEISLDFISRLDFVQQRLEPETVTSVARLFLVPTDDLNEPFVSRGERFLYLLKDLREGFNRWSDPGGEGTRMIDFRTFPKERFHIWSQHNNRDRADGTDSLAYAVYPPEDGFSALVDTVYHMEDYAQVSPDFLRASNVACEQPREGFHCINTRLDLQAAVIDYRIEVPDQPVMIGNIAVTPWSWTRRPDIPENEQGFEENEGYMTLIPLKNNQGTLFIGNRLINTNLTGDIALVEQASIRFRLYISGIHREARRRLGLGSTAGGIEYQFGRVTKTE